MKASCSCAASRASRQAVGVQGLGRAQEDGVQVTRGHVPGDLGATDHDEGELVAVGPGDLVRAVVVRGEVLRVRLVLDVIGDGDRVEPLAPGLLRADVRPHRPVGEDGVNVEVALQGPVPGDVRDLHLAAHPDLLTDGQGRQEGESQQGCGALEGLHHSLHVISNSERAVAGRPVKGHALIPRAPSGPSPERSDAWGFVIRFLARRLKWRARNDYAPAMRHPKPWPQSLSGDNVGGVTMVGSRARDFERDGYVAVRGLLDPEELGWYREVYGHRRALIVNFRPRAMVEYERQRGFDHGKSAPGRENRNVRTR